MKPVQVEALKTPGIEHGFFGRQGGVSTGLFQSMNVGLGSGDDLSHVHENRRRIAAFFGQNPGQLVTLYQDHTNDVQYVRAILTDRLRGDALVTDQPALVLGVLTADCVPVLLSGRTIDDAPIIAAIHAGWKGALAGIVQATVTKMRAMGCLLPTIRAAIGPCIRQSSYEVKTDLLDRFRDDNPSNTDFFNADPVRPEVYFFDLAGYVHRVLLAAGVSMPMITDTGLDTHGAQDAFFSYRRATHRGDPQYGRQISAIMIADNALQGR